MILMQSIGLSRTAGDLKRGESGYIRFASKTCVVSQMRPQSPTSHSFNIGVICTIRDVSLYFS